MGVMERGGSWLMESSWMECFGLVYDGEGKEREGLMEMSVIIGMD